MEFKLSRHAKIGLPPEPTSTYLFDILFNIAPHYRTNRYESIRVSVMARHRSASASRFRSTTSADKASNLASGGHFESSGFGDGLERFSLMSCIKHGKCINMACKDEGVESPENLHKRSWCLKDRPLAFRDATWIDELSHIITIFNP